MWLRVSLIAALSCAALSGAAAQGAERLNDIARAETHYAHWVDAVGALGLIDSGHASTFEGKSRDAWARAQADQYRLLTQTLDRVDVATSNAEDRRAFEVMRAASLNSSVDLAPTHRCADASTLKNSGRRAALYACFEEHGNQVAYNGRTLTRVAVLDLLATTSASAERRKLFMAFQPLWQSINDNNQPTSPYRKMIAEFAASADNTHVTDAAATLGIGKQTAKQWLVEALTTWREVVRPAAVEPWDYRYVYGEAERQLSLELSPDRMHSIATAYLESLGSTPQTWNAIYDLAPRAGKAPLAYADFVRRGRMIDGRWRPTLARVSGNYSTGRLGMLNELVHEMTHVEHMMALKTRPAFMDLGDPLFYEAVADLASWSLYEREWQQRHLGRAADQRSSLLALFSNVMLDMAWSLFDLTMIEEPTADPNAVWTDITHRYLNIVPHPELSWWCLRVQLVDSPGYMINYGLGAVVTADVRARAVQQIGAFTDGNPRWSAHLAEHLLRSGAEYPARDLLHRYLGRDVSPAALIAQMRRLERH